MSILSRFGFGLRFRWIVLLLLLALAGLAVYLLYPRIGGPGAKLELLGVGANGQFESTVSIPGDWAQPPEPRTAGVARFPLILGIRNAGQRPARATRLVLYVPSRYRLIPTGRPALRYHADGSAMTRYVFRISPGTLRPGRLPSLLPGLDTLWVEPIVPSYDCTVLADSVPEFIPTPRIDPGRLARIRFFYSFEGSTLRERQTGLLDVQLDPARLNVPQAPPLPSFPAAVSSRGVRLPEMARLRRAGSRETECGEPEDPYRLLSTVWETSAGGRLIVLDFGGAPRKYLLDMNRDSIVEYELWDPDADGVFEIGREARFPIPPYLLPEPVPIAPQDTASTDTTAAPPGESGPKLLGVPAVPREGGPPRRDSSMQPSRDTGAANRNTPGVPAVPDTSRRPS